MENFYQFDLLYLEDPCEKLNHVRSAEKIWSVFSTSKLQEHNGFCSL